jgi:hypothetical protein
MTNLVRELTAMVAKPIIGRTTFGIVHLFPNTDAEDLVVRITEDAFEVVVRQN